LILCYNFLEAETEKHQKGETGMSGIVCAIRGGPDSQPTIERSIQLAMETGLKLYFLYVVNLDFISFTAISRVKTVSKELHQMGEFILLTAQAKAEEAGITAEGNVRHGNVGDEIIGLSKELEANYVVLGVPGGTGEEHVFSTEQMLKFGERIERESGAKPFLAEEGEDA
jgi:nucleotide-binding universal stress UspA family protein